MPAEGTAELVGTAPLPATGPFPGGHGEAPAPLHDGPPPKASRKRIFVAALVALSGPVVGFLAWHGDLLAAIALHAFAAAVAWAYWRKSDDPDDMVALQAATLAAAFPVVGAPIALVIFGRDTAAGDDLRSSYQAFIAYEHQAPRWNRPVRDPEAELLREVSVRPLADQLRHGDLASKQAAADALRRLDGDEGVIVLRQALRHPADDTRLLASLALVKLDEQLAEVLARAREHVGEDPRSPQAQRELVRAARRYVESGLLAGKAAEPLWREVEAAAKRAGKLDPAHAADDELAVARARHAMADLPGALRAAERAITAAPDRADARLAACELLYKLGRTAELRQAAAAMRAIAAPGTDAHEIASFWSPAPAADPAPPEAAA